jgi:hypothetical protein
MLCLLTPGASDTAYSAVFAGDNAVEYIVMPHQTVSLVAHPMALTLLLAALVLGLSYYFFRGISPQKARFQPGDRVRVEAPDFWAHGVSGTIAPPRDGITELADGWRGHVRMVATTRGDQPYYWVKLDEARRDGDGDGPYQEAEIAGSYLQPLGEASRP